MNWSELTILLERLPLAAFELMFPLTPLREVGVVAGALVTLLGVRLCWQAPHYRMMVEERVKDGDLTEDQARRRMNHSAWIGPVVIFAGIALLAGMILRQVA
jgi:uncharacterized membrane protein